MLNRLMSAQIQQTPRVSSGRVRMWDLWEIAPSMGCAGAVRQIRGHGGCEVQEESLTPPGISSTRHIHSAWVPGPMLSQH